MVENPQLSQAGVQAQYNQHIQEGLRKSKLWEQFMTGIPNTKKGLYLRSMLGHLYDNLASMLQVTPKMVTEQTNTSQIGSFINYGFPMIRSIIPHLNAINLVTTQVLPAPQGFIFHLDYRRGTNKGRIRKGTSLFETLPNLMENSGANYNENVTYNGFEDYASENVPGQFLGTVPVQVSTVGGTRVVALTGTRTFSTSLEFLPIRPRTLKIYLAFPNDAQNRLLIAEDVDGTGVLTSTITNLVNNASVQYGSGLLQFTINASINFPARLGTREVPDATSELRVEVDWRYVSEGSNNIPEVDILVNSAPVTTEPSPLRVRWSIQAQANLKSMYDIMIQDELALAIANEIRFEIDTRISQKLKSIAYFPAPAEVRPFNIVPPQGVSYYLHKEEFVQTLFDGASVIEKYSGRGTGTWVICGRRVAALLRNLNDFVPDPFVSGRGIRKIGRLKGMLDIYYDPTYADIEWVMGYKSDSFLNAGVVYAPYIAFYATPVTTLDDLVSRQAMYSQYAIHVVNSSFYMRSTIVTSRP